MRVEIQIKSGHVPWAKKDQNIKDIDLQKLFDEYWTSKAHDLTVQGLSYSLAGLLKADREAQSSLLLESSVVRSNYVSR